MALTSTSTGRTQSDASQQLLLDLAARVSSPSSVFLENTGNAKGLRLYINTTASSTPSTVITISFTDYKKTVYYDVLASAAITSNGQVLMEVSPYAVAATNLSAQRCIGRGVRISFAHGNANSHTYSVTAEWLP